MGGDKGSIVDLCFLQSQVVRGNVETKQAKPGLTKGLVELTLSMDGMGMETEMDMDMETEEGSYIGRMYHSGTRVLVQHSPTQVRYLQRVPIYIRDNSYSTTTYKICA